MAKGKSNPKIKKLGNYIVAGSDYEEGKTELTAEQEAKMSEISKILTGYPHNFDTLHRTYAPRGIISVILMTMKVKEYQNDINEYERKQALKAIDELKQLFGIL
jgi:hypothetical protein